MNERGSESQVIVIRIVGDSGDGIQLVGELLTLSAAVSGKEVRTLPDFPAEIRAPAGTLAGISGFQLAMAEHSIYTAGETLDVLVALNPAALKNSIASLNAHGLLFINENNFQTKDWEKAGLDISYLNELEDKYQIITLPLIQLTTAAVKDFNLSNTQAKKTKNFFILGLVLWLFDLPMEHCLDFIRKKFKMLPDLGQANHAALLAGYHYAITLEFTRNNYLLEAKIRDEGEYRQLNGIEAVSLALATLAVKTEIPLLVAGYPITPASALLQECAKLSDFGISLLQAEDEIAAITACLGAAFGGCLALTCTSGPGFDLKVESLGLGIVAELPLVVLDVQRAGASTGLPTKTGQSDLNLALYGRHGEAPIPVLAAQSPADCFNIILEAFNIAIKYMTPVIVLLDAYLANAAEPWKLPKAEEINVPPIQFNRFEKPYQRDEYLARSWNKPGSSHFIHQLGGLEKEGVEGKVSYDAENYQYMVDLRAQKIKGIHREFLPLTIEGDQNAKILIIGWGSTYGSIKAALIEAKKQNMALAFVHLRYLNPLPANLENILQKFATVIVVELNTGQLAKLLRAEYLCEVKTIAQCNGQSFVPSKLVQDLREIIHEKLYAR